MSKQVFPSINLQSFNCPCCGALAHQFWFEIYANKTDGNKPHIWFSENYQQLLDSTEQENLNIPEELLKSIERQSQGEAFLETLDDSKYLYYRLYNMFISKCFSCEEISIWIHDKLIYPPEPEAEEANSDMPTDIKKDYQEARTIFKYSPKGASALLRLCVEKLCNHLGAQGDNLDKKIGYLVSKGLDSRLQKALDSVRVIGNEAVHPGQIDLNDNKDIARALFKLVNQIVKETITEEKEINEIYDILPENKKKGIEQRNKKMLGSTSKETEKKTA